MSRPEVLFAAQQLSKFIVNPTKEHIAQAVRAVAYLVDHPNDGVTIDGNKGELKLHGFTDASFGDDITTRKSTCGYVFMLGGPVSFKSGLQPLIAQSTTEAEYIAMTIAAREAAALKLQLNEIGLSQQLVVIYKDSQPAIDLLKRTAADGRTKHIDIRWHYVRQEVDVVEVG